MKLRPLTYLDKNSTATSKKYDDDIMSANCGVVVFFTFLWSICTHWEARFLTHGLKIIFSLIVTFYLTKSENRTKKFLTQFYALL